LLSISKKCGLALTLFFFPFILTHVSIQAQNRPTSAQKLAVPAPREVLGFVPGDDYKLASWVQFVEYFKKLDVASDRVMFQELGKTTLGRPFCLATISSPENLKKLDRFREIQQQ